MACQSTGQTYVIARCDDKHPRPRLRHKVFCIDYDGPKNIAQGVELRTDCVKIPSSVCSEQSYDIFEHDEVRVSPLVAQI